MRSIAWRFLLLAVLLLGAVGLCDPSAAQEPAPKPAIMATPEFNAARLTAWQLVLVIVEKLDNRDPKEYPAVAAWMQDFKKVAAGIDLEVAPEKWPALDADALMTDNPKFWDAYYEIAPGDPGLMILHGGVILAAGEVARAQQLMVVACQRPGVPKEFRQAFEIFIAHGQRAMQKPNAIIVEGIKLHDAKDYDGALKKYDEAIALWPQCGLAHFEKGMTLRTKQFIADGEPLPPLESVLTKKDGVKPNSPAVDAEYALARKHDPFIFKAYQGSDKEVLQGLMAMVKKGMPAWEKIARKRDVQAEDAVLEELAAACQEANAQDLALAIRQILVARRGRFMPADHPFLTKSLQKLAPGKQTDALLQRLATGELSLIQLVKPQEP